MKIYGIRSMLKKLEITWIQKYGCPIVLQIELWIIIKNFDNN